MTSFVSHSLPETEQIAHGWLMQLSQTYEYTQGAVVVGLRGHLGAGKTAFTKSVAHILGIQEEVTSPTFILMKKYEIQSIEHRAESRDTSQDELKIPWKYLVHIDAYRLEDKNALAVLEWDKLISNKNNLILIEWPEQVGITHFEPQCELSFSVEEHTTSRQINVQ